MQSVVAYFWRSSSGFLNETLPPGRGNLQDLSFLIFFFLTEASEKYKGKVLVVVTFPTRFVSS